VKAASGDSNESLIDLVASSAANEELMLSI
jgi:hypothetical protein